MRAHLRVNHSAREYVRTDPHAADKAHSNTAESWNATFKRAIAGVWHELSIKHLDRYRSRHQEDDLAAARAYHDLGCDRCRSTDKQKSAYSKV